MKKNDQGGHQSRLIRLRKRLTQELGHTEDALREDVLAPGEISSVGTHPADHDSEGLDEKIAIAQNEEQMLKDVEGALERIEAGTYGVCQECGRAISQERLQAIPYTPWCIDCARGNHNERPRPR
jgi:DnaK suppressor protein